MGSPTSVGREPDGGDGGSDEDVPDRDEILSLLEDGIAEAHRKVESGRVYDPENERVRIKWIKCLAYCAGQYRQLVRDRDLDELAERVEQLEDESVSVDGVESVEAGGRP